MPKNNKKKQKRNNNRSSKTSLGRFNGLLAQRAVRVPLRGIPFLVNSGTSGTGGLVSANTGASLANANSVPIDPFTLGGRCSTIAADFLEYRILWIRFTFHPYGTSSGVAMTPAGLTTTPSYAERAFAWGCFLDPGISGSLSYQLLVEYGANVCRTCQPYSFILKGGELPKWRFQSTTSASPTAIDLRMVSPVKLWFYFADTSTTLSTAYGAITYDAEFEFRGAADNLVPIGLSSSMTEQTQSAASQPQPNNDKDEFKTSKPGWFGL